MKIRNFLMMICCFFAFTAAAENINFFSGSFAAAQAKASQEGKLLLVAFETGWCQPCDWMDKNTYSNDALARYARDIAVAVKVDIDGFEGAALKKQHNVKLLPTLLIMNSRGTVLERHEEALNATSLLAALRKNNTSINRIRVGGAVATPVSNTAKGASSTRNAEFDGLYRVKVQKETVPRGYSVQIGAFSFYEHVVAEASKLEKDYNVPVFIHIGEMNGQTIYKVLAGQFTTKEAADSFRKKLKSNGKPGLVKALFDI